MSLLKPFVPMPLQSRLNYLRCLFASAIGTCRGKTPEGKLSEAEKSHEELDSLGMVRVHV